MNVIPPQTGVGFQLAEGDLLIVEDLRGCQVADLFCFPADDLTDALSSGRSIDYNETTRFKTGHRLFSNSGRVLMTIESDSCGVHDFLVTPCSLQMFRMMAQDCDLEHPSCLANLIASLEPFGVDASRITTTFNVFMNVPISENGTISVQPPISQAGTRTSFRAETALVVGLTACSDEGSNGGSCKPVGYTVVSRPASDRDQI